MLMMEPKRCARGPGIDESSEDGRSDGHQGNRNTKAARKEAS